MNFSESNFEVLKINNFFSKAISPKIFNYRDKNLLFFAGEKNDRFTKIYKIDLKNEEKKEPDLCFELEGYFQRVLSPDLIFIDNKIFMFFEGKRKNKTGIFYAKSDDMSRWDIVKEPLIFDEKNQIDYGAPKCIFHPDSRKYYLYYYKKDKSKKNIYLSIIDKHLKIFKTFEKPIIFSESKLEEQAVYSPDIHINNSSWQVFYAAWGQKPLKGIIMSAVSKNGIDWTDKKKILEPNIFADIKHCSEPCLIKEKNSLNLYYEGCDIFNNWKIIKKTLALK